MRRHQTTGPLLVLVLAATGCGGSMPAPTERLANAQSAARSARELGAEQHPQARLSLKRAQDQIDQALSALEEDENREADSLLIRARADAELAVAQTRENAAHVGVNDAKEDSAAQKATNSQQGAMK